MAVSVKVQTKIIVTDNDGTEHTFGPYVRSISSLTEWVTREYSIGDTTTQNAWDPTAVDTEVMSSFSFMAAIADGDVFLGQHIDDGGEVGKIAFSQQLSQDIPLMLGADDAYANAGADDAFAGTEDVIDRLYFRNESGATRIARLILAG